MTDEEQDSDHARVKVEVPRRHRWGPFDQKSREAFCRLLGRGMSRSKAIRTIKLHASTVNRWISIGKRAEREFSENRHLPELLVKYLTFWNDVQEAEATADMLADTVLVDAALGTEIEHRTADGTLMLIRIGGNWRAADALGKRRERRDLHPLRVRITKANAAIAEANIRIAQANARRAAVLAEVAKRSIRNTQGLLVFPAGFLQACTPEERSTIEAAMRRLGFDEATPDDAAALATALSEHDVEEVEAPQRGPVDTGGARL